jgi:hypothetical protein
MHFVTEELEKYERVKQLERLGHNVPVLTRIPCGTLFDRKLEKQLLDFAGTRRLMTVRTYAPEAEKLHGGGPFFPEIPVRKAISKVRELLPHYHVLFQEAVDWKKTRLLGRTLFDASRTNSYEVLRGKGVRVRDLDEPPHGMKPIVGFFSDPGEISDPEIREVTQRIYRIPRALREPGPIIVEWNLQEPSDLVGVKGEPLLLWEWRPGA